MRTGSGADSARRGGDPGPIYSVSLLNVFSSGPTAGAGLDRGRARFSVHLREDGRMVCKPGVASTLIA